MCVNCISSSEQFAAEAALVLAVLRDPLHRALAATGVVAPPDPVGREARTVGFLRALDLEPVEVLGAEVVERADAWVPPTRQRRPRRWLRPIGSQSLLSPQ
jgi:hypothetical protein